MTAPVPAKTLPRTIRYSALDGYRFVAAVCVVVYHYNIDFRLGLERLSPAVPHLSAMVDFFFLLSGFVIGAAYLNRMDGMKDYALFLRARLARIYPLHLLTAFASLALVPVSAIFRLPVNHPEILGLSGLPANLALIHAWGVLDHPSFNVPSWSISAEWFVYLLVPAFFFLSRRLPVALNLLLVAGVVMVQSAARQAAGLGPWTEATFDFGALRAVPTFFAGVLVAANIDRLPAGLIRRWWPVHALFLAALAGLHLQIPQELVAVLFGLLIAAAALAERDGAKGVMTGKAMVRLGDASFAIYMLHVLVSIPLLYATRKAGLIGTSSAFACALLALAVTVVLSLAVHARFELPCKHWLGAARSRRRLRAPSVVADEIPAP